MKIFQKASNWLLFSAGYVRNLTKYVDFGAFRATEATQQSETQALKKTYLFLFIIGLGDISEKLSQELAKRVQA